MCGPSGRRRPIAEVHGQMYVHGTMVMELEGGIGMLGGHSLVPSSFHHSYGREIIQAPQVTVRIRHVETLITDGNCLKHVKP